jgi:hypothetical protein
MIQRIVVSLSSGSQSPRSVAVTEVKVFFFFIVKGAEGDEGKLWMMSQRCISYMHRVGHQNTG